VQVKPDRGTGPLEVGGLNVQFTGEQEFAGLEYAVGVGVLEQRDRGPR
jgi:hypothetical protein